MVLLGGGKHESSLHLEVDRNASAVWRRLGWSLLRYSDVPDRQSYVGNMEAAYMWLTCAYKLLDDRLIKDSFHLY